MWATLQTAIRFTLSKQVGCAFCLRPSVSSVGQFGATVMDCTEFAPDHCVHFTPPSHERNQHLISILVSFISPKPIGWQEVKIAFIIARKEIM